MKGASNAMKHTKDNQGKLIEHLYAVMNRELEKPYTEIDADFVNACVELILELQGKNFTLSNEEIEEKVSKIPFVDTSEIKLVAQEKKKKLKTKKILLIAAVIALLCALLAVFSTGQFVEYWQGVMSEKFGSMFDVPAGETFSDGNDEFVSYGKTLNYTSVEDFYENEHTYVLIPKKLPNDITITNINVDKKHNTTIVTFNSIISGYDIILNTALPQSVKDISDETRTINNTLCYINRIPEVQIIQIFFEYNNNYYNISGTDEQILFDIIDNLEIQK